MPQWQRILAGLTALVLAFAAGLFVQSIFGSQPPTMPSAHVPCAMDMQQRIVGDDPTRVGPQCTVTPPMDQSGRLAEATADRSRIEGVASTPYEARDIVAQETMADATVWMAIVALLTLFVTGLGTWLIRTQVKLTRVAIQGTGEATKAMLNANAIAERNSFREFRAYLGVRSINFFDTEIGPDHPNEGIHVTVRATVEVHNYGRGVARQARVGGRLDSVGRPVHEIKSEIEQGAMNWVNPKTIFPGESERFEIYLWRPYASVFGDAAGNFNLSLQIPYRSEGSEPLRFEIQELWYCGREIVFGQVQSILREHADVGAYPTAGLRFFDWDDGIDPQQGGD